MPEASAESVFEIEADEALEARLDAEAEADYAAGRTVPHEDVAAWLMSWGSAQPLACPVPKRR